MSKGGGLYRAVIRVIVGMGGEIGRNLHFGTHHRIRHHAPLSVVIESPAVLLAQDPGAHFRSFLRDYVAVYLKKLKYIRFLQLKIKVSL